MSNDLLLDLLTDILGDPRNKGHNYDQFQFNCLNCADEKGEIDNKYNLEVNVSKNVTHCWSCDFHGSLKKLVNKWGTRAQKQRLKILLPEDYKPKEEELKVFDGLPNEYIFLNSNWKSDLKNKAMWYLNKRGIGKELIEKFKIGFAEKGKYSGRIIIPSFNKEGVVDYFVSRTFTRQKPKYLNPDAEKSDIIFNEKHLSWYSTIYFVEGPFDHIVVPNSIPGLGKVMSDEVLLKIRNNAMADVVIVLDGDAWGNAVELYNKLNAGKLYGRVKIVKLPEKYDTSLIYEKFNDKGISKVLSSSFKLKEHLL